MSFDLSYVWNLLNGITTQIQTWFTSVFGVVTNIANTGQGIFSGLVAFGSQIWDAILKAVNTFSTALYNTFSWIYNGLVAFAQQFGQWIGTALSWIGSAFGYIAQQIYNFGTWLYNGAVFIVSQLGNIAAGIFNAITTFFSGVASAIFGWAGTVSTSVNSWYGGIITGFRNKMIQTIQADLTISMAWKGGERILNAQRPQDFVYGLIGIVASPLVGYLVGTIVEMIVPFAHTTTFPLVPSLPSFSYTPPAVSIPTATEKPTPSIGAPLTPIGYFTGISDITVPISLSHDETWVAPASVNAPISATHSESQVSSDEQAQISLSFEAHVEGDEQADILLTYETEVA